MRYPASEKLEIIQLVEQSHLPAKQTLDKLGIPRATFYRWYEKFQAGGVLALEDHSPKPKRVWNRIDDKIRDQIVKLARDLPELSPRELAVHFTDTKGYFVSEASVYRLLRAHAISSNNGTATDPRMNMPSSTDIVWKTNFINASFVTNASMAKIIRIAP